MYKYLISNLLAFLGLGSLTAFNILGSKVDAEGVLHEQFALVPIGIILIILGLFSGLVLSGFNYFKYRRGVDRNMFLVFIVIICLLVAYFSASMAYLSSIEGVVTN
jgi:hypothetical protein